MAERISVQTKDNGKTVEIRIVGEFLFDLHAPFREAYRSVEDNGVRFVINLAATTYLDSSALAMILLLLKHVNNDASRVILRNASPAIRKILSVAQFNQLATVE